ncbi:MAG: phospholipase D family protein [Candidatus Dasytiphilus stammeri]
MTFIKPVFISIAAVAATTALIFLSLSCSCCAIIDNNKISVGFTPSKNSASNLILNAINKANHKIDIAAYSFTSKNISLTLLQAKKRGVTIRIVADYKANHKYTAITFLANKGISVRLNRNYSIMHNKFMIIDNQLVQTGSYNYTVAAANHNAENIIIIYNAPNIASKYNSEFNRLWKESTNLVPQY